jgi:hypothetical protein
MDFKQPTLGTLIDFNLTKSIDASIIFIKEPTN